MPLVIHLNLKYSVLCPFKALFERIGRQSYIMNYFHISLVLVFFNQEACPQLLWCSGSLTICLYGLFQENILTTH